MGAFLSPRQIAAKGRYFYMVRVMLVGRWLGI
jgi:hypothetical protein